MGMAFCRGCGKEIHESAPTCPHCGALQGLAKPAGMAGGADLAESHSAHWASITALVTGILVILLAGTEPEGRWSSDAIAGGFALGCVPIVFGVMALAKRRAGRWMAISGVVLGVMMWLATLGGM